MRSDEMILGDMKAAAKAAVLGEADVPADSVTAYRFEDNYVVEFYCDEQRLGIFCSEAYVWQIRQPFLADVVILLVQQIIRKHRDYLEHRPK